MPQDSKIVGIDDTASVGPVKFRENGEGLYSTQHKICIAVTGASGSVYAERLIVQLLQRVSQVYLVASDAGTDVAKYETRRPIPEGFCLARELSGDTRTPGIIRFANDDFYAPIASGSSVPSHLVIVPCSMGTMSRISTGNSTNLIERAADVVLKQRKRLIICPRETPLNAIHLRNMLTLAEMGTQIVPLMPGFYTRPKTLEDVVDFMVGRILELLDFEHTLYDPWGERRSIQP